MTSINRAMDLMMIPVVQVPRLALDTVNYLARTYGLSSEVCLTAYAAYAEVIEGLPCVDNDYRASPDLREFLEGRK